MKVFIDRDNERVYVQEATPKWAFWVGYHFALNHRELARDWYMGALDAGDVVPSNASECHRIVHLGGSAGEIAQFIKNPPKPPHDCPDCKCPPGCCR